MTISPPERGDKVESKLVERLDAPVTTELWRKPGWFDKTLKKGPETTTWIWNLHANAHDFDSHTNDLQEVSRKIFSAHFGHLAVIFVWMSGFFYHSARFSNYSGWLQLLVITIIGIVPILIWLIQKGQVDENRFGENPLNN